MKTKLLLVAAAVTLTTSALAAPLTFTLVKKNGGNQPEQMTMTRMSEAGGAQCPASILLVQGVKTSIVAGPQQLGKAGNCLYQLSYKNQTAKEKASDTVGITAAPTPYVLWSDGSSNVRMLSGMGDRNDWTVSVY